MKEAVDSCKKRIFQGREIIEGSFSWWIKSNDSYVEARCFDVSMMLKDQILLSFIQDKNPRKSRYIIKFDLLESLGRSFQIETNKRFDQRILSFQIEIFSLVIDYRQLKMFITVTRNLNSKFIMCNRLHMDGNWLQPIYSNFKACDLLHKSCNRLPEEIFRK